MENDNFRDYANADDKVVNVYKLNHQYQTVDFAKSQIEKYCTKFGQIAWSDQPATRRQGKCQMSIWDAINRLDSIIDESDPDTDSAQIVHAFQTAEALRKRFPDKDWLHLVGLIHDLGKVLLLPEFGSQKQWSVVGDTFPLGCQFSDKIVYPHFFEQNPDYYNPLYKTKLGIYQENCGLNNVLFSFGHDEYLYKVLVHNNCLIPEIGLRIIRFHSFYPWHKSGAYEYLEDGSDIELKKWCQIFSQCDLYTKDGNKPDIEKLKPYYYGLVNKYFPNKILDW